MLHPASPKQDHCPQDSRPCWWFSKYPRKNIQSFYSVYPKTCTYFVHSTKEKLVFVLRAVIRMICNMIMNTNNSLLPLPKSNTYKILPLHKKALRLRPLHRLPKNSCQVLTLFGKLSVVLNKKCRFWKKSKGFRCSVLLQRKYSYFIQHNALENCFHEGYPPLHTFVGIGIWI